VRVTLEEDYKGALHNLFKALGPPIQLERWPMNNYQCYSCVNNPFWEGKSTLERLESCRRCRRAETLRMVRPNNMIPLLNLSMSLKHTHHYF